MASDDHALCIGIGTYPQLSPLSGPVADATAFRTWLTSPSGGAVPQGQAALVVSPKVPPKDHFRAGPTLSDIQAELDRIQQQGIDNDGVAGRRLWLYFAGHGIAPQADDTALVMANANINRMYHLPAGPYLNWFRTAALFDEVVVVADCCRDHNGRVPAFAIPWGEAPSPGSVVHYFTAFATKWSGKAREKPIAANGPVRGIFTRAVLEGLQQGKDTAAKLEEFVEQRLPELCDPEEFQEPEFSFNTDLQLAATAAAKACTLKVEFTSADPAVTVSLLDGRFKLIQSFPMTGGSRSEPLDPGLYVVRRSDQPGKDHLLSITAAHEHVRI